MNISTMTYKEQDIGAAEFLEAVPGGLVFFDRERRVHSFNDEAQSFLGDACMLCEGMDFGIFAGALQDIAAEDAFGEAGLLIEQILTNEECTVDYRRFDGKSYRVSVKHTACGLIQTALLMTDISDISETENLMSKRGKELVSERNMLISRLKLVDAIVTQREAQRHRAEFYVRLTRLLDRFESAIDSGNINLCRDEIQRQREYAKPPSAGTQGSSFIERLKQSVSVDGDLPAPRVVFHHIAAPKCGNLFENDIIEATREGVLLIAICGLAGIISVSLRVYEGGMELSLHSDEPVVADYETAEPYARLQKIAKRMQAEIETDATNGFEIKLRCTIPAKEEAVRRYKLTEIEQSIIEMIGQGMSSEKVAAKLHYSQGSLRNMLSAIYEKLGISDKAQLTAFSIFNGFADSFTG